MKKQVRTYKTVNISPDAFALLTELCDKMSTRYINVKMNNLVAQLIADKLEEVNNTIKK